MNMDEKDISIAEDEDSCTNGCPVRFVRIMVTPWKMNGWDPKITQLKGNSFEPNLHFWVQNVNFPECSINGFY